MEKIDNFFLTKFQKTADFLQDEFGIHVFILNYIVIGLWLFLRIFKISLHSDAFEIFAFIVFAPFFLLYNRESFRVWKSNPNFLNLGLQRLSIVRLISLMFLIVYVPKTLNDFYLMFFVSHGIEIELFAKFCDDLSRCLYFVVFYFMSCSPKPPRQSKFKKRLLRFKENLNRLGSSWSQKPSFS